MQNRFLFGEMEREVKRRVAAGDRFTALNISRAVQASGVRERHRNLKTVVHELWMRGAMGRDYVRTLVPVGSGVERAYLYHRDTDDVRLSHHAGRGVRSVLFGERTHS